MKKTRKKVVHVTDTYHLSKEVKYVIEYQNDKEVKRYLKYTGKKHYGYGLTPVYKEDLSLLKSDNPYWDNFDWLRGDQLPMNPEDVDLSKIVLCQGSTHMFFDIDKNPIPVVVHGEYCEGHLNDYFYDLDKLEKHLLKSNSVVKVERKEVPYYSESEQFGKYYLDVLVLPSPKVIQNYLDQVDNSNMLKDYVFGRPFLEMKDDFLKIKKFVINTKY